MSNFMTYFIVVRVPGEKYVMGSVKVIVMEKFIIIKSIIE